MYEGNCLFYRLVSYKVCTSDCEVLSWAYILKNYLKVMGYCITSAHMHDHLQVFFYCTALYHHLKYSFTLYSPLWEAVNWEYVFTIQNSIGCCHKQQKPSSQKSLDSNHISFILRLLLVAMITILRDRRELFQIDYAIVPAQVIMVNVEA